MNIYGYIRVSSTDQNEDRQLPCRCRMRHAALDLPRCGKKVVSVKCTISPS